MSQEINLYHPIFRREEKKFSAQTMLQAGAIVFGAVILLTLMQWWQVFSLQSTYNDLERQRANLQQRALEVRTAGTPTDPLALKVTRLEKLLVARRQLQQELKSEEYSNTSGYSEHFKALGRQNIGGMWLTGFSITDGGSEMTLAGRTRQPSLVPKYIQKLSREKILSGIEFNLFRMKRPPKGDNGELENYVEFVASTMDLPGMELKPSALELKP